VKVVPLLEIFFIAEALLYYVVVKSLKAKYPDGIVLPSVKVV
jgi:hypothetical protein